MKNTIGERIKFLREHYHLSQEELAKLLQMDRTIISNIERGKRALKVEELTLFSSQFNISITELLGTESLQKNTLESEQTTIISPTSSLRNNVPIKNMQKFTEALLYILKKTESKPNIGSTVLYKLLYFIDFNHYEKYEEQLIGATYIKNKFGPTPKEFLPQTNKMIQRKEIKKIQTRYYNKGQTKYLSYRDPNIFIFSPVEIKTINEVLYQLSDMNADKISDYSHQDIPWLVAQEGEAIEYESVFYRTPIYSVRENENTISNSDSN